MSYLDYLQNTEIPFKESQEMNPFFRVKHVKMNEKKNSNAFHCNQYTTMDFRQEKNLLFFHTLSLSLLLFFIHSLSHGICF